MRTYEGEWFHGVTMTLRKDKVSFWPIMSMESTSKQTAKKTKDFYANHRGLETRWCDRCLELPKKFSLTKSVPKIHDVSNHPSVFHPPPTPKKTDGTVRPKSVPGTIRSFFSTCSARQRPTTCVLEGHGSANLVAHKANAWALSICLALGTWHPNGNPVCFGYFHGNNDTWHILKRKGTSKGSFLKWNHSWIIGGLISGFIKACWLGDWKTLMDLTTECSGTSPVTNKGVWHILARLKSCLDYLNSIFCIEA